MWQTSISDECNWGVERVIVLDNPQPPKPPCACGFQVLCFTNPMSFTDNTTVSFRKEASLQKRLKGRRNTHTHRRGSRSCLAGSFLRASKALLGWGKGRWVGQPNWPNHCLHDWTRVSVHIFKGQWSLWPHMASWQLCSSECLYKRQSEKKTRNENTNRFP